MKESVRVHCFCVRYLEIRERSDARGSLFFLVNSCLADELRTGVTCQVTSPSSESKRLSGFSLPQTDQKGTNEHSVLSSSPSLLVFLT